MKEAYLFEKIENKKVRLPGDEGEKTFCHGCGTLLIDRFGFSIAQGRIKEGHCPECNAKVPGVWDY